MTQDAALAGVDGRPATPGRRPNDAASLRSRLTLAGVAALLGVLAIGQLNGQSGVPGLSGLSATELTQLIANLTTGNDQLRDEITDLQRQEAHLTDTKQRGDTTVGELSSDLNRIRAWSGVTSVTGQGIVITIQGPIGGDGVQDLLNELRNAGAEAIAVDGVRVVTGIVVAGQPGELSVENQSIGDAFEIRAIGSPQILTGTLTRTGGVIAQVATAYPDARLTVTPIDSMTLPASDRTRPPTYARPRL
ncbi:MAG TPA: DUF881 domain-containing protein [Candidatus Limnocylindrales bacterium]|nr:DUF881 domain-containing protein [Candidatus Limnocylindrales bacterium]